MNAKSWTAAALGASLLCLSAPALAGDKDFVIYAPGAGGTAADAKPYLETFFGYLEKKLGWPAKSGHGEYIQDVKDLAAYVEKTKPGFGLVSPSYYLDLGCRRVPVTLVAAVVRGKSASTGKYHLVVKKGTAKTLEDVKGKRLISNQVQDPKYVSRVIFDGKIDVQKHFGTITPTASPLKPFKAVDRGEADAALVTDEQLEAIKAQPAGAGLESIFTSADMPPAPVIAFDAVVKPADRDALKKALVEMCTSKEGAETCKSMTITRFEPVAAPAFAAAQQKYCKP